MRKSQINITTNPGECMSVDSFEKEHSPKKKVASVFIDHGYDIFYIYTQEDNSGQELQKIKWHLSNLQAYKTII